MAVEKSGDNTRVSGDGGSITYGPTKDPQHPGETFISVNTGTPSPTTGKDHSMFVTGTDANGNPTLIRK